MKITKKKNIVEEIFKSKKNHDEKPNSPKVKTNFLILSQDIFFINLYNSFVKKCHDIFGDFTLHEKNSNKCWSLCTNKNYWVSVVHDHIKTSTINAVYYVNVPKINNCYVGEFKYLNDKNIMKIFYS